MKPITIIVALIVLVGISSVAAVVAMRGIPSGPTCGNGLCEIGENEESCPADCVNRCGDGFCSPELGETEQNCPADCYVEPPPACGNGVCDLFETFEKCPTDCAPATICGNGVCETGETQANCPQDCMNRCGDGFCSPELGETEQNCPADCQKPTTCIDVGTNPGASHSIGQVPGSPKIGSNPVYIKYQRYSDGYLYVQTSYYPQPVSKVTADMGRYDCLTYGRKNAEKMRDCPFEWIDDTGFAQAIELLKQNIPCDCSRCIETPPPQPCPQAIWSDFPECDWDITMCPSTQCKGEGYVGEVANLVVKYQKITGELIVRLEKGLTRTTTYVGKYDCGTYGKTNADTAMRIGWADSTSYPLLVSLLAQYPACDCFQ